MREKGKAMMGRGEASGEKRVLNAGAMRVMRAMFPPPVIVMFDRLLSRPTAQRAIRATPLSEDPQYTALCLIVRPERSTQKL